MERAAIGHIVLLCAIVGCLSSQAQPYYSLEAPSAAVELLSVRCNAFEQGRDSVISCRMSFSGRPAGFSYDVLTSRGEVGFAFPGVALGGQVSRDMTLPLSIGPLKAAHIQQRSGGESSQGQTAKVTLEFNPAPRYRRDVEIQDDGNVITASLLWPRDLRARARLYQQLKGKSNTGLVVGIASVTAAALAGGAYYYWTEIRE